MTAEFSVAVHGLVYLLHKGATVPSAGLADNICTNPARVRKIMAKLGRAGLVLSSEGRSSGYRCAPGTEGVTLLGVLEALGESVVSMDWRSGDVDRDCLVCSGMGGIMEGLYSELDGLCRARLAKTTIGDIEGMIFGADKD